MAEAVKLPARLDLPAAVPLLNELRAAEGDVILDGAEVTHFGALCAQVLVSGAKTAAEAGREFRVENLNEAAQAQLGFMGLDIENLTGGNT